MKKIYELARQRLKEKHNIDITEKKLEELYSKFITRIIEVKRNDLKRDVFIPQFGTIKLSEKKLERKVSRMFKNRDPEITKYIKTLREFRSQINKSKQYKNDIKGI